MDHLTIAQQRQCNVRDLLANPDALLREGVLKLLEIKDSDIRLLVLEQGRDAIDKGVHAGGAFSAVTPLVALYYGGFLEVDVVDPTRRGQDVFVLSKGHAVAALAAIYAELGYFDKSLLKNSRSYESILNGHPGPILPGIPIATGPMGQGFSVAQGFAFIGRNAPHFDSYAVLGDGELQEGTIWEGVMFAGQKNLDNLCILVDHNKGQLDIVNRLIFPMPELCPVFRSFNWRAIDVDATQYGSVYAALEQFKHGPRNGQPTAIICHCTKGQGAFSDFLNKHKVVVSDALTAQEIAHQSAQRQARVEDFARFFHRLDGHPQGSHLQISILEIARQMHLAVDPEATGGFTANSILGPVLTQRVPPRDKQIRYDASRLPRIDKTREYASSDIITAAMKVFADDPSVVSIDSDLASTSGLEAGIAAVDQKRALNAGVAEANMMALGEAYAAMGFNAWISTFCPFFDWKVLRRIAVGHQERLESMESRTGWLSEGHGLDLTLLATGPNFETRTNGATHMGNDDITIFDGLAHLKIIDVSCPQQLLAIMKWIMAGNKGLTYVRVMRTGSKVLYDSDYTFEFGKGHILRQSPSEVATIISSNRGTHEALSAAEQCAAQGLEVGVVDMPSIDEELLVQLYDSGKLLFFAEHNNGYIWQNFLKIMYRRRKQSDMSRIFAINSLGPDGRPRFIHSGTYEEIVWAFGLAPSQLTQTIKERMSGATTVRT